MKLECEYQTVEAWSSFHCTHPKRTESILVCKDTTKCSHWADVRKKCTLARTYLELNVNTIDSGVVKACPFTNECKQDMIYPECNVENVKDWAENFKETFVIRSD